MGDIFKWAIYVKFDIKGQDKKIAESNYEEFKRRMMRSGIKGCKLTNFSDKHLTFYHVCNRPTEVFEFFYVLNPMPGDDILNGADVSVRRAKVANKTGGIMKEVN